MKNKEMTATKLRVILAAGLFVIVGVSVGLFYLVNSQLTQVATDVSKSVAEAKASEDNLQTLQKMEKILSQKQEAIQRTASIVADSKSYQYQNQIISDLNDYADRAKVKITNIDFSAATNGGTSGGAQPTAPATASPAAPNTAAPGATGQVAAPTVKSTSVSVSIKNPVPYNNLLRFIRSIEQNLTKMQVSNVSLSRGSADTEGISSDTLTIEVYIR